MKTILDFARLKRDGQKIAMLTCYDYASARIVNSSDIDCILVGDSVAMTMHGHPSTLHATIGMMALHTSAVARGAPNKLIVADLPFLSYRKSLADTLENAQQLMLSGATAVKLEGVDGHADWVQHLVQSGIPVVGHLGMVPQSVNTIGGYKVQPHEDLLRQAQALENAGACAVVLECVPLTLAKTITSSLSIPTIGIGAGVHCDGQVLVWQDMLGMDMDFTPKFLRRYHDAQVQLQAAINRYAADVHSSQFPNSAESYAP
jgi:3-methyl-2-oxobutanoate hydroxymethyltransferase